MSADPTAAAERARFEPAPSELGGPFWEATRDGILVLPWCRSCERPHWYPRMMCPHCRATSIDWRPSEGRGVVHAVSVQHRPGWMGLADRVPYAVAVVELAEGVRMLSNLVGDHADELPVGAAVELAWEPLSDGRQLAVYQAAQSSLV